MPQISVAHWCIPCGPIPTAELCHPSNLSDLRPAQHTISSEQYKDGASTNKGSKKLTVVFGCLQVTHCRATERHLPYHTVSSATQHKWTCPALTPARQADIWFTYPRGMVGWVDLDIGCILRWFTCPPTVTHPSTSSPKIATQPELNPHPLDHKSDILLLHHQATVGSTYTINSTSLAYY